METTVARRQNKTKDIILLVLRIGVGAYLAYAGIPKLMWGPSGTPSWSKLGETMGLFGITFAPTFWGFMAAFAEGIGGILIALGLIFRPAAFLALCTMFVATYMHITQMGKGYELALTLGIFCLIFLITGPGRYSIDNRKSLR
jgi:putative oxidoreductase